MRLLTSNEMKLVEQYTAKFGLSYQRMMENAGAACARNIKNIIEKEGIRRRNIVVVCGKGNNGGDGFVIARKFAESGYNVCVILASGYPSTDEASYMYKMVLDLSITTVWYEADRLKALQTIRNAEIIVDAVYGFSFYGNIKPELYDLFDEMNGASALKFAVDVPSGVYCDSGYRDFRSFVADYTIAISALKPAHIVYPAADCCGNIIIANIGIPQDSYNCVENSLYTLSKTEIGNLLKNRENTSHKGTFGHLLCICGSKRMPGAAYLSAKAALRSGVGLVTAAFPECIYNTMSLKLDEALLFPLKDTANGSISRDSITDLLSELDKYTAIVIGCGLTVNEDTRLVLEAIIKNAQVPVLIDADGINIVSENIDILKEAKAPVVLTPHPKEMSRLLGADVSLIQSDRVKHSKDFAIKNNVCVVLKGSNTVVSCADTQSTYVNASGNSGLSKGGSGDVLSGIIGAFLAQGICAVTAATSGVYIHGHAADNVADSLSKTGMLPTAVINELAKVYGEFDK